MATAQMMRQKSKEKQDVEQGQGEWTSMFPADQLTEIKSTLFVKKLLAVAVSTVSYLRALFPEEAFGDRCLEEVQLKILRDDSAYPEACKVIQWLRGCFDALEKKYLRSVMVGLYENPEDPNTVIEEYSFKFSYGNGKGMDIYRNGSRILSDSFSDNEEKLDKEVKRSTIRLLRTIVMLSQTLDSLPDKVVMAMKINYYDEITPEDYQPPGFKDCDTGEFDFQGEPLSVKVGQVSTNFHSLRLRIKSQKRKRTNSTDLEEVEKQKETIDEEAVVPSDVEEILNNVGKDFNDSITSMYPAIDANVDDLDKTKLPNDEIDPDETQTMDEEVIADDPKEPVKMAQHLSQQLSSSILSTQEITQCSCGGREDDGVMILCAACNTWQHAICYTIMDSNDAPETHYCVACAKKHGQPCTDPELVKVEDENEIVKICLWRRALMAVSEINRVQPTMLAKRLVVPINMASALVQRLEVEGFLKAGGKGKRFGKLVQKDEILGRGVERYFRPSTKDTFDDVTEKASLMQLSSQESELSQKRKLKTGALDESQFDLADSQSLSQMSPVSNGKRRKTSIHTDIISV